MLNTAITQVQEYYKSLEIMPLLLEIDNYSQTLLSFLTKKTSNQHLAKILFLKISNLLIAKYHFIHKQSVLTSYPFGLLVDPSNNCPLQCPGCLHGDYLRTHSPIDWPNGFLQPQTFAYFINIFGPYALYIHFFNWGEPLLNKETPHYITLAKQYGLNTVLSSNLSINFDAEKLVLSGLDFLIISADGATAETYQKYRRGGDFDLVIKNIEKLVAAKKKYNSLKPVLQWQFLTFKHNIHEINIAQQMAQSIGVNSIRFAPPYDVSWAEPFIIADSSHNNVINFTTTTTNGHNNWLKVGEANPFIFKRVFNCYKTKWSESFLLKEIRPLSFRYKQGKECHWLYKNLIMDAHGRILPCCYAPEKSKEYNYVFASISDEIKNIFNSPIYVNARKVTSSYPINDKLCNNEGKLPYCSVCKNQKKSNIDNRHIQHYFKEHKQSWTKDDLVSDDSVNLLAEWDD